MSSDSATIIRDGDVSHRIQITHRDWMLTAGPGFVEGRAFTKAFGVFENYTVAGGIPKGSLVYRKGNELFAAASELLKAIQRDYELLQFDYSYQIEGYPKSYGGGQSICIDGCSGILSLRPKGYCSIRLLGEPLPDGVKEIIDLRPLRTFKTDIGMLKVYRRKAQTKVQWTDTLPPLLDFLSDRLDRVLSLEHIDRVV
ncbi:MAG: hypothetical protein JNJ77_11020 [Planctomycetia bacterium]|nr:hypothetical protein [Planctomycetia bacterium]